MLGEVTFYASTGEAVILSFNGGQLKIRKPEQKPYEAVKVDSFHPLWSKVYDMSYGVAEQALELLNGK